MIVQKRYCTSSMARCSIESQNSSLSESVHLTFSSATVWSECNRSIIVLSVQRCMTLVVNICITCNLTTQVSIKLYVWVVLSTGLYWTSQLVFFYLTIKGAVSSISERGHTQLHTAAGLLSVKPPPFVLHHQQPRVWTPALNTQTIPEVRLKRSVW